MYPVKEKFWTKSLLDDDDIRTVPSWILRCVKGKERFNQKQLLTSNWTRWNSKTSAYFPNIQEKDLSNFSIKDILGQGISYILSPFVMLYC